MAGSIAAVIESRRPFMLPRILSVLSIVFFEVTADGSSIAVTHQQEEASCIAGDCALPRVEKLQYRNESEQEKHQNDVRQQRSGHGAAPQELLGDDYDPTSECTLYMAPSTIPNAGLGIFTTIEREIGDMIGKADVVLPIVDVWYHKNDWDDETDYPFADYIWHGPLMGMQQETTHPEEHVTAFAPGLDAAINCHLGLVNVEHQSMPQYDWAGLHRSVDPGVGAFTPYYNVTSSVTHHIPAGGELFKHYGNAWFKHREEVLHNVPLSKHIRRAENLMRHYVDKVISLDLAGNINGEILNITKQLISEERTLNALDPVTYPAIAEQGNVRSIYQQRAIRSVDDLKSTGRCLDHIEPGLSTIRQAGRGAFATRRLPKGSIVAGTPMVYSPSREVFNMYDGDWWTKNDTPDRETIRAKQLAYNYCWTHPESSIFLCPYGATINLINHNQTRANVRVQWAKDKEMNMKGGLLHSHPAVMGHISSPGLAIDFVATRDIEQGEEIFLDYGDEWEAAWNEHVENWKHFHHDPDYQRAREWSQQNPSTVLRTVDEQRINPYPTNFAMRCLTEIWWPNEDEELTDEVAKTKWSIDNSGMPCNITYRVEDEEQEDVYLYKVVFKPTVGNDDEWLFESEVEWKKSDWIGRSAISFVDVPYSTDNFLNATFRHPIAIPDDIFPDAWRGFWA